MKKSRALLFAGFIVPLTPSASWKTITYDKIKPSEIMFSGQKLQIKVKSSASPVIYKFPTPSRIARLTCSGRLDALPSMNSAGVQGDAKSDDFALRVGLVLAGTRKLNGFERLFAPQWVKDLQRFYSETQFGFGGLQLFLLANAPGPAWETRVHPKSSLIREQIIQRLSAPGDFSLKFDIPDSNQKVLGLWVGADGDDTKSTFSIDIDRLEVEFKSPP